MNYHPQVRESHLVEVSSAPFFAHRAADVRMERRTSLHMFGCLEGQQHLLDVCSNDEPTRQDQQHPLYGRTMPLRPAPQRHQRPEQERGNSPRCARNFAMLCFSFVLHGQSAMWQWRIYAPLIRTTFTHIVQTSHA
jgi:hypothetical protein